MSEADRALRAYLSAVIFVEPVQVALLQKHGVRLVDMRALRRLRDLGTVPISCFTVAPGISRSTATGLVDRLEERRLVEHSTFLADRSMIHVSVTERGRMSLEDRTLYRESLLGRRIAALPVDKQQQLADLLE
jgi:DNA-binding MarR family transcriptional regulator